MIPDLDIYRSAQVLMKQHGPDAPIHAAMRADAMLEAGDLDGYAVWKRVLRAVEELQRGSLWHGCIESCSRGGAFLCVGPVEDQEIFPVGQRWTPIAGQLGGVC